jgi:hypothetical protein
MAVGVPLSPVVATATAIPRLVRRQLAVTVGANEPQILTMIIACVSIDVVDDQRQGGAVPPVLDAADRTATALLLIEVIPDVVALIRRATTDSGVKPGFQEHVPAV